MAIPIAGQCAPSSKEAPTSTVMLGTTENTITSLSASTAPAPRSTCRTTAPEKLSACHEAEKRCTRANASAFTSRIMRRVRRTMPHSATCLTPSMNTPSAASQTRA